MDCDEPIPEARRLAAKGCYRCIDCQGNADKKGLRHAG
ncbi:TraR/DksA C4-type zinc finger protein [Pseudomonas shirazensis]